MSRITIAVTVVSLARCPYKLGHSSLISDTYKNRIRKPKLATKRYLDSLKACLFEFGFQSGNGFEAFVLVFFELEFGFA